MAENEKQRFRAKPQIQASDITDADLLIMEHEPNTDKDADKSLRMDQARKYFEAEEKLRAIGAEKALQNLIDAINSKIPSAASEKNKLADIQYVNESIQTNTAVNRGDFATYANLVSYSGQVTRNDYATVRDDETHSHECWRYKWNDDEESWKPEYRINESPMTQAQLAALNSGITEEKIEELEDDIEQAKDDADEALDRISYTEEDVMSLREWAHEELNNLSNTIGDIDKKAIQAKGTISSGDLDDFETAGMWRVTGENVSNLPAGMGSHYGQLLVMSGDNFNYPTQIFSVEGDDGLAGDNMYYRKYDGEEWTRWVKLITKNNFIFNSSTGTLTINM